MVLAVNNLFVIWLGAPRIGSQKYLSMYIVRSKTIHGYTIVLVRILLCKAGPPILALHAGSGTRAHPEKRQSRKAAKPPWNAQAAKPQSRKAAKPQSRHGTRKPQSRKAAKPQSRKAAMERASRKAAKPQSRKAAKPQSRHGTRKPQSRKAAKPQSCKAAKPQSRKL